MRATWFFSGRAWGSAGLALSGAAALALTLIPRANGAPDDWKDVVSAEGGFRLKFPSAPKFGQKTFDSGAGALTAYAYSLEEGPISFYASWLEFPAEYARRAGDVRLLNGAKESFFKRFKGKFLEEKIVSLGVAPGRDSLFETEDQVKIRLRIFLRGRKLIQTMVMSEPEYIDSADAKKFFDSLKWDYVKS